jgi:transglutaminase-like putative cysteine protease
MAATSEVPELKDGQLGSWAHVTRALYRVQQEYHYIYSQPVQLLQHQLMVVPPPVHGDQRLIARDLKVTGAAHQPHVSWEEDSFGNSVCRVGASAVEQQLNFEVSYLVERQRRGLTRIRAFRPPPGPPLSDLSRLLESTRLTEATPSLERIAARIKESSPWPRGRAFRAYHWAAAALNYRPGVTDVATTAAEAMALGSGVCQDFTHVLLTVLRLMGIPARYVSGQMLGDNLPHAWVEALFVDDQAPETVSVAAYDPTNRREPGLSYIWVATGRDHADVTPTSGSFAGPAQSQLQVSQRVELVELSER